MPTGYLLARVSRGRAVLTAGAFVMGLASGARFVAADPLAGELYPEGVGRTTGIHGTASQLAAAGAPLAVLVVAVAVARRAGRFPTGTRA